MAWLGVSEIACNGPANRTDNGRYQRNSNNLHQTKQGIATPFATISGQELVFEAVRGGVLPNIGATMS
jgi:hypothetical protein